MSAETEYDVQVVKEYTEWVKISATTLEEARAKAKALPDVVRVEAIGYAE